MDFYGRGGNVVSAFALGQYLNSNDRSVWNKVGGWIHLKGVYINKTLIETLTNILLGFLRHVDSLKETLLGIIDDFLLKP
jgi:hypothetical protein